MKIKRAGTQTQQGKGDDAFPVVAKCPAGVVKPRHFHPLRNRETALGQRSSHRERLSEAGIKVNITGSLEGIVLEPSRKVYGTDDGHSYSQIVLRETLGPPG